MNIKPIIIDGKPLSLNREMVYEIARFTILWNIFENNVCQQNCSFARFEEKVQTLTDAQKEIMKKLAAALQTRMAELNAEICIYVEEILFPLNAPKKYRTHMNEVREFIETSGHSSLAGGLWAVKRIRNNMFHGYKKPPVLADQFALFQAINSVLEEMIK